MSELDDKIREALQGEDADFLQEFGSDPSIFEMVAQTFRGRHRWLVFMTIFWGLAFSALGIVAAVKFFSTDDARDMMLWALGFIFCMSAVSMMKVWYWMELNKNAIMREIKRLELQVARLSGRAKE